MSGNLIYYVGISHVLGIGPIRLAKMISRFGDIKSAYNSPVSDIKRLLGQKIGSDFDEFRKSFSLEKETYSILSRGISILTDEDTRYPKNLKHIYSPPICLYVKGKIDLFDFNKLNLLSIVGSRKTTTYGRKISYLFAKQLVQSGWVIVSGMAIGIDEQAHWGAIEGECVRGVK